MDCTTVFAKRFTRVVLSLPGRISIGLVAIGLLVAAGFGAGKAEVGLPLADIVPSDHYSRGFLDQYQNYYTAYPASFYLGKSNDGGLYQIDYANKQADIIALEQKLQSIKNVDTEISVASSSWLDSYILWMNDLADSTGAGAGGTPILFFPCSSCLTSEMFFDFAPFLFLISVVAVALGSVALWGEGLTRIDMACAAAFAGLLR